MYLRVSISFYSTKNLLNVRTSSRGWQFCQSQQSVVTRDGLKSDIGVPLRLLALALVGLQKAVCINLLGLLRGNDADFIVFNTVVPSTIVDWVNVQPRCLWLSTQLAKTLYELLLKVVGDVVLLAEENDTSLGDLRLCKRM